MRDLRGPYSIFQFLFNNKKYQRMFNIKKSPNSIAFVMQKKIVERTNFVNA